MKRREVLLVDCFATRLQDLVEGAPGVELAPRLIDSYLIERLRVALVPGVCEDTAIGPQRRITLVQGLKSVDSGMATAHK